MGDRRMHRLVDAAADLLKRQAWVDEPRASFVHRHDGSTTPLEPLKDWFTGLR